MTGRYCSKHEEYSTTGICRWCEPTPIGSAHKAPTHKAPAKVCMVPGCSNIAAMQWVAAALNGLSLPFCSAHRLDAASCVMLRVEL